MAHRKHTVCGGCRKSLNCHQLELMWRFAGEGPWTWIELWTCAGCRVGVLDLVAKMGVQLMLWDG